MKYSYYVGSWEKTAYIKKYSYLSEDEIAALITECKAIQSFSVDLAKQLLTGADIWELRKVPGAFKEQMESAIYARYPYLEPRRVLALISLGFIWVVK